MEISEFAERITDLLGPYVYADGVRLPDDQAERVWEEASELYKEVLRTRAERKRATHKAERKRLALAEIKSAVARWGSLVIFAPYDGEGVHVIATRDAYEQWDAHGRTVSSNGRLPVGLPIGYVAWVDSLDEAKLVTNRDCEIVRLPNLIRFGG